MSLKATPLTVMGIGVASGDGLDGSLYPVVPAATLATLVSLAGTTGYS